MQKEKNIMSKILIFIATDLLAIGCTSTPSPQAPGEQTAATQASAVLDYGDYTSQTLTTNA